MDLHNYFQALRRRWLLIVLCVVVGAGLGALSTAFRQSSAKSRTYYKATNTLVLSDSGEGVGQATYTNLDQIAVLGTTGAVPGKVATDVGSSDSGAKLAEHVVTLVDPVTNTLAITAVGATPTEATQLADSFAKELVADLNAKEAARFAKRRDALLKQLADFQNQASGFLAALNQTPRPPDADTIQKQYDATQNQYYVVYGQLQQLLSNGAPQAAVSPLSAAQAVPISRGEYDSRLSLGATGQNHLRADGSASSGPGVISTSSGSSFDSTGARAVLGGVLGLLVGIALALMWERLDRRIRTRTDVELAYELPVLAEVPTYPKRTADEELLAHTRPMSPIAEAYRSVRTSVMFEMTAVPDANEATAGREHLVLMVTSAVPGEGKSATSANLAVVFAESGATVLVVNCDFRRPTVHRWFGLEDRPRRVQSTSIPGVKVVTNVLSDENANPAQYIAAQQQVVNAAREHFDVVILDTAPVLAANDPLALVPAADLVVVVARAEVTRTHDAERTAEALRRLQAPVAGVLLAGAQGAQSPYYYQDAMRRPAKDTVRAAGAPDGVDADLLDPFVPARVPGDAAPAAKADEPAQ